MIEIIIMEPSISGNIGAIARVMKNFGFSELVLINPKCDHLSQESRNRAKHANDLLKKTRVEKKSYLDKLDYLIGTTSVLGTDYNIPRSPISPEELAAKLAKIKKSNIGILFGRESSGLTNKEIQKCDFIVTIPTPKGYPALNISHSMAIVLYEIFKRLDKKTTVSHITPSSKKEKEIILKYIDEILDSMEFATKEKKETQRIVWKRIIGKALLTRREAFAMLGFLRKVKR